MRCSLSLSGEPTWLPRYLGCGAVMYPARHFVIYSKPLFDWLPVINLMAVYLTVFKLFF